MASRIPPYPFSAIVGQAPMKQALTLAMVNPRIGGVLLRGHRGTAKSTAVRGLAELMPPRQAIAGCPFSCDPQSSAPLCDDCRERQERGDELELISASGAVVDLPLGCTEDRLLGAIDLEAVLTRGERRFEPGLLARANGAVLYVDEVNLLADHLVDLLLDVAATGVNRVEREGVSLTHPSQFVLVGTMNPEEGDLRPQLLDRFGLCVDIKGSIDTAERVEVAKRRLAYEADPAGFAAAWAGEEERLGQRLLDARRRLPDVVVPEPIWELAAKLGRGFETEGHRADVTMLKAAITLCAWNGHREVSRADLGRAAELALAHRVHEHGLAHAELDLALLEELLQEPPDDRSNREISRGILKKKSAMS